MFALHSWKTETLDMSVDPGLVRLADTEKPRVFQPPPQAPPPPLLVME